MAPGAKLAKVYQNLKVPLGYNTQQMMVKITAPSNGKKEELEEGKIKDPKAALDIVVVLDISGSMAAGRKLENMKKAMELLIDTLGDYDRLAVVPFNKDIHKDFRNASLVPMDGDKPKEQKKREINRLKAEDGTNIKAGLEAGIKILKAERNNKQHSMGQRASCIFLLSDGEENSKEKVSSLITDGSVGEVTIHAFGFGTNHNEKLMFEIAYKSHVGIYHHVPDPNNEATNDLKEAFGASLAIYRTMSMLGLKVTLIPEKQMGISIEGVKAGDYVATRNEVDKSWTIPFGDLAREENRRILFDVKLLANSRDEGKPVKALTVKYEYTIPRQSKPGVQTLDVQVTRARDGTTDLHQDVNREMVRRRQADYYLTSVKNLADSAKDSKEDKLHEARVMLRKAEANLNNNIGRNDDDPSVAALYAELGNLDNFLDSYKEYEDCGRAYLLACLSSHGRQRHASRGGENEVRFYLTKKMDKYLDDARIYQ